MRVIRSFEYGLSLLERFHREAVMHLRGRQEAQTAMVMVVVVPVEVVDAEAPRVFEGAKTVRKIGPILHRFELALGEGIVV